VYSRTRLGAASTICSKLSSTISTLPPSRAHARCAPRAGFAVVADAEGVGDRGQQQPVLEHALEQRRSTCRRGRGPPWRGATSIARPALADAAGADEAHDAVLSASRAAAALGEVVLAADRGRVRRGHARRRGSAAPSRGGRRGHGTGRSARRGGWPRSRPPASSRSAASWNGRYAAVSSRWMRAIISSRRLSRWSRLLM
jgi:hypothetical protein